MKVILQTFFITKFKGKIYTPYIGISLVRSSGCFYKGNYFYDLFIFGGSGSEISGIHPLPGIFKWNSPYKKVLLADGNRLKEKVSGNNEDNQVSNLFLCSTCFYF